jgi:ATP-dependent DNA helicase PIF1
MKSWISSLAERLLGVSNFKTADVAAISKALTPAREPDAVTAAPPHDPEFIEIIPEYEFVLELVKNQCPATFVTGRAGTGKSTLIRFLSANIPNCAVVAPTGMAAMNVHGSTIHSFFNIPHHNVNPDEPASPTRRMTLVMEAIRALIVDEVSMVTPDLLDCMNLTLKKVRRNSLPFGGVPVIFVGDLLQLPPVVSNPQVARFLTHRYGHPFFFAADVFREAEMASVELTKVFRQDNLEFVEILDRIRRSDEHREAVAHINRMCHLNSKPHTSPSLFLVPTKAVAASINTEQLDSLEPPLAVFVATYTGKMNPGTDRFQAPARLELKIGAQVLFVKNKKPYWVNGTLGTVVAISPDIIRVELREGNTVSVERETWEKIEYRYDPAVMRLAHTVVGTFVQFPLTLGWAITIHKSQGMTLDTVRIDMGNGAFCSGQTYVALSRCKTIGGIHLDTPIKMGWVKADPTILEFYRQLNPARFQHTPKPNQSVASNDHITHEDEKIEHINVAQPSTSRIHLDHQSSHGDS